MIKHHIYTLKFPLSVISHKNTTLTFYNPIRKYLLPKPSNAKLNAKHCNMLSLINSNLYFNATLLEPNIQILTDNKHIYRIRKCNKYTYVECYLLDLSFATFSRNILDINNLKSINEKVILSEDSQINLKIYLNPIKVKLTSNSNINLDKLELNIYKDYHIQFVLGHKSLKFVNTKLLRSVYPFGIYESFEFKNVKQIEIYDMHGKYEKIDQKNFKLVTTYEVLKLNINKLIIILNGCGALLTFYKGIIYAFNVNNANNLNILCFNSKNLTYSTSRDLNISFKELIAITFSNITSIKFVNDTLLINDIAFNKDFIGDLFEYYVSHNIDHTILMDYIKVLEDSDIVKLYKKTNNRGKKILEKHLNDISLDLKYFVLPLNYSEKYVEIVEKFIKDCIKQKKDYLVIKVMKYWSEYNLIGIFNEMNLKYMAKIVSGEDMDEIDEIEMMYIKCCEYYYSN